METERPGTSGTDVPEVMVIRHPRFRPLPPGITSTTAPSPPAPTGAHPLNGDTPPTKAEPPLLDDAAEALVKIDRLIVRLWIDALALRALVPASTKASPMPPGSRVSPGSPSPPRAAS
ncbi:MAG: hypothetical protein KY452_12755 [Actinobacteria bacterium]|nr:hypothetical protein [Actinomycetota bacterium]